MTSIRRQIVSNGLKVFDLALMVFAFVLAALPVSAQHAGVSFSEFLSMRVKVQNVVLFCCMLLAWHIILSCFELYESKRLSAPLAEALDVIQAISVATLVVVVASLAFHVRLVTPLFVTVFWLLTTTSSVITRLALRHSLGHLRARGRNLHYVLIVGSNPRAVAFARKLEQKPEFGCRIVGFVDEEWPGMEALKKTGYPLICNFEEFPRFLRQNVVDEVVMGLPIRSYYSHASRIAVLCEEQGITLRFLSDIFDLKLAHSRAEEIGGDPLITVYRGTQEGWTVVIKRALDIAVSAILLALLAPVFLVVALLIKLTSPGKVFFIQKRVGLNKRIFNTYKFRTMVPDAEKKLLEIEHLNEVSGPVFKIKNDPRITPVGRLLRKTSIDELPQLINVLKGEMSLVGPRPMAVRDYEGFDKDWQRRRFSVRPGITCLWQINGRSSVPFEKWMELDMQYIDKWSLWLDLKILVRTIPAVLKGSGAA